MRKIVCVGVLDCVYEQLSTCLKDVGEFQIERLEVENDPIAPDAKQVLKSATNAMVRTFVVSDAYIQQPE